MKVFLEPGKYVVAVSGGVDSMVLLDVLGRQPDVELIVAHFDHGIRRDSGEDRHLVQEVAKTRHLPFQYAEGRLGPEVSEATARDRRYNFLRRIKAEQQAAGIVTAHHQDDLIETALLNLLRGTGHKGIAALRSHDDIVRPLLGVSKQQILEYARQNGLRWREDSTNSDQAYLRNYIRLSLLPKLQDAEKQALLACITATRKTSAQIDELLTRLLRTQGEGLDRLWFSDLPHDVSREVMAAWLRHHGVRDFDRPLIERLVVLAKTAASGKIVDVIQGTILQIGKNTVKITHKPLSSKSLTGV